MDKDGEGSWIPILNDMAVFSTQSFEKVSPLYENTASVSKNDKWGLFGDGKLKTEIKYPLPLKEANIDGYLIFGAPGALGLMTKDGEEILKDEYDSFENSEKIYLIEVMQKGYTGIFDIASKDWILPLSYKIKNYEFLNKDKQNKILIYNGKWGLADAKGKIIMPMNYDKNYVLDSLNPQKKSATDSKTKKKQLNLRKKQLNLRKNS